jgi:1-phosphatidylinositol-3-phosphate 5-kinase
VKQILNFMTYIGYNSLLELCFAMDEFAMPPPGSEELDQTLEGFESSSDLSNPSDNPSEDNPTCIKTEEEPIDIVEVADDTQESGITLSASPVASHSLTAAPSLASRQPSVAVVIKVGGGGDSGGDEEGSDGTTAVEDVSSNFPQSEVEYTSFQHNGEEDMAPPSSSSSSSSPSPSPSVRSSSSTPMLGSVEEEGGGLEVPAMQRQLSQATELTEFTDPLRQYQKNQDDSIFKRSQSIQFQEQKQTLWHKFRQTLHGTLLSASPYIKYAVPYLESETGCKCELRKYLPEQVRHLLHSLQVIVQG